MLTRNKRQWLMIAMFALAFTSISRILYALKDRDLSSGLIWLSIIIITIVLTTIILDRKS